jgi:hypothetical protein
LSIKIKNVGNLEASSSPRANSSCVISSDFFSRKMESFCVNGWNMRHRKDCQWCRGEGEGIVVIQPLHMSLEVRRRTNSKSAEGGMDILRSR